MYAYLSARNLRVAYLAAFCALGVETSLAAQPGTDIGELPSGLTNFTVQDTGNGPSETLPEPNVKLQCRVICAKGNDPGTGHLRRFYAYPCWQVAVISAGGLVGYYDAVIRAGGGAQQIVAVQYQAPDLTGSPAFYGQTSGSHNGLLQAADSSNVLFPAFYGGSWRMTMTWYKYVANGNGGYNLGSTTPIDRDYHWFEVTDSEKLPKGDGQDLIGEWGRTGSWDDEGGGGGGTNPMQPKVEDKGELKPKSALPLPQPGTDAGDAIDDSNNQGVLVVAGIKLLTSLLGIAFSALPTIPDPMPRVGTGGINIPAFGSLTIPAGKPIWYPLVFVCMLFDDFLPMKEILSIVGVGCTVVAAIVTYRGVKMLINVIRGAGA